MKQRDRIGILIGKKNLTPSELQLLGAGRLMDKNALPIKLLGKKNLGRRQEVEDEGLDFVKIGKIIKRKDFNSAIKLGALLKEEGISTIIFRNPADNALLVTTKFLMKGRLRLIFVQDRPIGQMGSDFIRTFQFNQIDAWITPLMQTAKNVKTFTNLDHAKVHVFSLPIARKPYVNLERMPSTNDKEGHKSLGWFLPESSELRNRTGGQIAKLLDSEPGFNLVINVLKEKFDPARDLPILSPFEDRIKLVKYSIDDPGFYSEVDACLVDTELEPFSGISVRLLFSGVLPLVEKNLLSGELFENGKLCFYLPSENDHKLHAEEIYRSVSSPNFRRELREKALSTVGKRYTKKRFKENITALIAALPVKALFR